jgi:hypothetical protein
MRYLYALITLLGYMVCRMDMTGVMLYIKPRMHQFDVFK